MTEQKPDVQALIERLAAIRAAEWMTDEALEVIVQAEEALSARSGETETEAEWGVKSWVGDVTPAPSEETARRVVRDAGHLGQVVSREVTPWVVFK